MPDLPDDEQIPQSDHEWARLRKEAKEAQKRADALEAERDATNLELAMARAGVDLTDPRSRYFVKGYEGDRSTEAIKAEWAQFAGGQSAPASQPTPQDVKDAATMTRIQNAADGGTASPVPENTAARAKLFADINVATAGITDPYMKQQIAQQMMQQSGLVDFGVE